jgi:hypothetical protein
VVLFVFLCLILRLVIMIDRYAVNVFSWDQWAFLDALFHPRSLWELFRWQNGPHRMGLGLPLMVGVEQMTHWNAVAISYLNAIVMAAAGMLAIVLKRRVAPPLRYVDLALPFLFLNSSQWAIFVVTPDVSHGPLPLLFVILFVTILTIESAVWRLVLLLLVDLLATYTGFGIFLGWITPLVLLFGWRRSATRRTATLLALAGAFAILASFFYDYHFPWHGTVNTGSCLGAGRRPPQEKLIFFFLLFARAFGATRSMSFPTVLGVVATAALTWQLVKRSFEVITPASASDCEPEVIWTLAAFTLVFATVTSAGRSCLGAHSGLNSRYVPYIVPGMLALYLSYGDTLGDATRPLERIVVYAFLVAYVGLDLWPRSMDYRQMQYFRAGKVRWIECFRAEHDERACTQKAGGFTISGEPSGLEAKLAVMEQQRLGFFVRR